MVEGVLAAETVHTQRHVLDHSAGRLSVDQVPVEHNKRVSTSRAKAFRAEHLDAFMSEVEALPLSLVDMSGLIKSINQFESI